MKIYTNLWRHLTSYPNLELAFKKARKRKTKKAYIQEFEKNLDDNLTQLQLELNFHIYTPKPLTTFIIRDPKTRKISKADFRDRVIHHALCNVLEPLFDSNFIHDSYANRRGKGTLKAIQRFDQFKRKVYNKTTQKGYVLKGDIKHYFDEIDQKILIEIIERKIKDTKVLWLIKQIIHNSSAKGGGASEVFR
ncbi:MAG: reverse transcriptase domain-containing protein [Candidatus Woesearchaeota archaeon]|nr:reverse transcriptase domain-containing protein [Candidatus Woesearchaeota archaeon]